MSKKWTMAEALLLPGIPGAIVHMLLVSPLSSAAGVY